MTTAFDLIARLGAERSATRGHTIREWTIHPVGDRGWTMGARGLYGASNLVIDRSGNVTEFHIKSPEAALTMLAEQVAAKERRTSPTDPSPYLRVDRLGWELVFRRGEGHAFEMWSACDQEWQPADLLAFFPSSEAAPLVPLSPDTAREWLARLPRSFQNAGVTHERPR